MANRLMHDNICYREKRLEKGAFYISPSAPDIKIKVVFIYFHGKEYIKFKGTAFHARLNNIYDTRTYLITPKQLENWVKL